MVNDTLAQGARVAHDWVLQAGSAAACTDSSPSTRPWPESTTVANGARSVNAAWNGYNVINAAALGSVALGWFGSRLTETRPERLSETDRRLATAKDGFTLLRS